MDSIAEQAFQLLKTKLPGALLALLDFDKVYKLDCDAFHVDIGAILSQAGQSLPLVQR